MTPNLNIDPLPTGIPYWRPEDDPTSHGYVNLRKDPVAIDLLPELRDDEVLRRMVALLNEESGVLETVGCLSWDYEDTRGETDPHSKACYISTIFTDERFGGSPHDWFEVFLQISELCQQVKAPDGKALTVTYTLKPFGMHDTERTGWQCEVWVWAIWSEFETAQKLYSGWLDLAVKALDRAAYDLVKRRTEGTAETAEWASNA